MRKISGFEPNVLSLYQGWLLTILPICVDQSVITFSSIFWVCTLCLTIIWSSPKYPVITIKFIVSPHYFPYVQSHVRFLRSSFHDCPPSAHCKAAISFHCHPFSLSGLSSWTDSLGSQFQNTRRVMCWDLALGDFTVTMASCLANASDWSQGKPDEGWIRWTNHLNYKTCVQLIAD